MLEGVNEFLICLDYAGVRYFSVPACRGGDGKESLLYS